MACHLIEEAKNGSLDPQRIKDALDELERLVESDKFDVSICRCKTCQQAYIYCFREFNSRQFQDYYWNFWVPVTDEDISGFKKIEIECGPVAEIIRTRPHIARDDKNKVLWYPSGNPVAHTLFTIPYVVDYPL